MVSAEQELIDIAIKILLRLGETGAFAASRLAPDGSSRRFWRLGSAIAVAPAEESEQEMREAKAAWKIGSHLYRRGCAVPEIYGWDAKTGLLVMEDLGSIALYQKAKPKAQRDEDECFYLYQKVLKKLAQLQIEGARGFQEKWCWDTPRYDTRVMLEKESGYFLRAWWQGRCGRDTPAGVVEELETLAMRAAQIPTNYFLHRDCQARNIMLHGDEPFFIDFQGGRFGPLAYDLASLLIDPYTALSHQMQNELIESYINLLIEMGEELNFREFKFWYNDLAAQRNMQIIGAFSFLCGQKKKMFFEQFIEPAVTMLRKRLEEPQFADFTQLRMMVGQNFS